MVITELEKMSLISYNSGDTGIRLFKAPNGKIPFKEWINGIKDTRNRARIRRRIDHLAVGHYGDHKRITKDLYELRLFFGPGYRVYFTVITDESVILLLGGDKGSQSNDIENAKQYLKLLQVDGG